MVDLEGVLWRQELSPMATSILLAEEILFSSSSNRIKSKAVIVACKCARAIMGNDLRTVHIPLLAILAKFKKDFPGQSEYLELIENTKNKIIVELALVDDFKSDNTSRFWNDFASFVFKENPISSKTKRDTILVLRGEQISDTLTLANCDLDVIQMHPLARVNPEVKKALGELFRAAAIRITIQKIELSSTPYQSRSIPTVFEVAQAWSPLKKDRFDCSPTTVAILSQFRSIEVPQRYSAKRIADRITGGTMGLQFCRIGQISIEIDVQWALIRKFQKSLASYASGLRSYGTLCKAMGRAPLPPDLETIQSIVSKMTSASTGNSLIAAVFNCCAFLGIDGSILGHASLSNMTAGLRKYNKAKPTSFWSRELIPKLASNAAKAASVLPNGPTTVEQSKRLQLEVKVAIYLGYVFQMRWADEAFNLVKGNSTDHQHSDLNGRKRVICKPSVGLDRVIVKLCQRKNRKTFISGGHCIVRYCSCTDVPKVIGAGNAKILASYNSPLFCPVHCIWTCVNVLAPEPGNRLFKELSPRLLSAVIKAGVALDVESLGDPESARIHCLRKSATNVIALDPNSTVADILLSGDWSSEAFKMYVDREKVNLTSARDQIGSLGPSIQNIWVEDDDFDDDLEADDSWNPSDVKANSQLETLLSQERIDPFGANMDEWGSQSILKHFPQSNSNNKRVLPWAKNPPNGTRSSSSKGAASASRPLSQAVKKQRTIQSSIHPDNPHPFIPSLNQTAYEGVRPRCSHPKRVSRKITTHDIQGATSSSGSSESESD